MCGSDYHLGSELTASSVTVKQQHSWTCINTYLILLCTNSQVLIGSVAKLWKEFTEIANVSPGMYGPEKV